MQGRGQGQGEGTSESEVTLEDNVWVKARMRLK